MNVMESQIFSEIIWVPLQEEWSLEKAPQKMIGQWKSKYAHHVKMDLHKKSGPKKKSVQNLIVDAKGFRKTMN